MPSSKFRTQKATNTHWARKKNAEWGKNISQVFGGQVNELTMLTLAKSDGSPSVNWTLLSMWWFQGDHFKRWTFSFVFWCAVGWNKTRPLYYFSIILSEAGSLLKFQCICPLMGHSTGKKRSGKQKAERACDVKRYPGWNDITRAPRTNFY